MQPTVDRYFYDYDEAVEDAKQQGWRGFTIVPLANGYSYRLHGDVTSQDHGAGHPYNRVATYTKDRDGNYRRVWSV